MQGKRVFVLAVCAVVAAGLFFFLPDKRSPENAPNIITVDSSIVHDGGVLGVQQTCDGGGVRPPLVFSGVPDAARSLAIMVSDTDASEETFIHWTIWNIDAKTVHMRNDELPRGAVEGMNSAGTVGWIAPCPPSGSTHGYIFTVYALDVVMELESGVSDSVFRHALQGHVLAKGAMTMVASR